MVLRTRAREPPLWSSKKATKMVTLEPNWLASIRKHNANGVWISHQSEAFFRFMIVYALNHYILQHR